MTIKRDRLLNRLIDAKHNEFVNSFRKVVITGNLREKPWRDENGIVFIGAMEFLLDPNCLETL